MTAAEGGADPNPSLKTSLGDTVRADPAPNEGSLIAVNADIWSIMNPPDWKPARRLAPESKELLLFKSAMFVTLFSCGMLLLELENNGTGGRWRN